MAGLRVGLPVMRVLVLNAGSSNLKASVVSSPDSTRSFDRSTDWTARDSRESAFATVASIVDAVGKRGIPEAPALGSRYAGVRAGFEAVAARLWTQCGLMRGGT